MQTVNDEKEHITSVNSSPRTQHKSTSGLFGLLAKRSIKVEPHPVTGNSSERGRSASVCLQYSYTPEDNKVNSEHDISFAKCTTPGRQIVKHNNSNGKSQTLPASIVPEKTHNSIVMALHGKGAPQEGIDHKYRHSGDAGSQSDGGEVVLRKTKKQRAPAHNRFSNQFSLCCKVEKKPATPPVTVRYSSIPDAAHILRSEDQSLSLSLADNTSLLSTHNENAHGVRAPSLVPLAPLAPLAALSSTTGGGITECASAPESPIISQTTFSHMMLQSSPSNSSMRSTQSDAPHTGVATTKDINDACKNGSIRPIAISACRSRLRLKLYPPGKELHPLETPPGNESMKKATTPSHMSSPNITTQPELTRETQQEQHGVRFISHENIQMQRQGSSSGLARQALMAAQVLSLIPTEKVRERSFLEGRLGACSLLGPTELSRVLPNKEVTIFVGTWNMNGQNPPKQMNDFVLPATMEHVPDMVVLGTQESTPDRFEWEATLQETLGPTHVLFHSTTLGTLHLAVYMRRDLIWYCSAPEDANMSVRTGSAFRTKGAVAISFCLFGTSMLFVTSHLTAHQQKVKERVSDVKRITHALDLPRNLNMRHKNKDVTQNFDNVFWCGDLNFRLGEPREKLLEWIQHTKFPLPSHLPHGYMHTDQLSSVLSDGAAFRGFMEANITFPPTYKYDPGTQHFDTSSKQRAPAYTDRILYKYRQSQGLVLRRASILPGNAATVQPPVECLLYDSVPSITTSDHKPVWALFKSAIRAGTDSIPLAAGLFNRDIYLEGMKRRLNNQYAGSSAVCSIQ